MIAELLICPVCLEKGKRSILGSITIEGYLEVQRYQSPRAVTLIKYSVGTIICPCGWGTSLYESSN